MSEIRYSVIMPAYNEESRIASAVDLVVGLFEGDETYELVIVDDGSSDRTVEIAQRLSETNPHIRVLCNEENRGRGYSINRGYQESKGSYLMVVQGKLDTSRKELRKIISAAGTSDLVLSYQANANERPAGRRVLSALFVAILNATFRKRIKYYNGTSLISRAHFLQTNVETSSYAYDAELLLKLLKSGLSYIEVPVYDIFEKGRKSRAFTIKNLLGVLKFYLRMVKHYYIKA